MGKGRLSALHLHEKDLVWRKWFKYFNNCIMQCSFPNSTAFSPILTKKQKTKNKWIKAPEIFIVDSQSCVQLLNLNLRNLTTNQ